MTWASRRLVKLFESTLGSLRENSMLKFVDFNLKSSFWRYESFSLSSTGLSEHLCTTYSVYGSSMPLATIVALQLLYSGLYDKKHIRFFTMKTTTIFLKN